MYLAPGCSVFAPVNCLGSTQRYLQSTEHTSKQHVPAVVQQVMLSESTKLQDSIVWSKTLMLLREIMSYNGSAAWACLVYKYGRWSIIDHRSNRVPVGDAMRPQQIITVAAFRVGQPRPIIGYITGNRDSFFGNRNLTLHNRLFGY